MMYITRWSGCAPKMKRRPGRRYDNADEEAVQDEGGSQPAAPPRELERTVMIAPAAGASGIADFLAERVVLGVGHRGRQERVGGNDRKQDCDHAHFQT